MGVWGLAPAVGSSVTRRVYIEPTLLSGGGVGAAPPQATSVSEGEMAELRGPFFVTELLGPPRPLSLEGREEAGRRFGCGGRFVRL